MKTLNLVDLLTNAANSANGVLFLSSGEDEKKLSYSELLKSAKQMLGSLQKNKVLKGEELIIFTLDNELLLTSFWACILGGIVPIPLSAGTSTKHIFKLLQVIKELSKVNLAVDEKIKNQVKKAYDEESGIGSAKIFSLEELASNANLGKPNNITLNDIAFIQFSSGSTGNPKGVVLTHRNLYFNTLDIQTRAKLSSQDTLLSWMPLTHDMGMICCHLTGVAAQANQILLTPYSFIRRPLQWMEKADEYGATILFSPNFGYQYLLQALDARNFDLINWDLSQVRLIFNGAEMISSDICNKFIEKLKPFGLSESVMFPGYGLAEASVAVSLPITDKSYSIYNVDLSKLNTGSPITFLEKRNNTFPLVSLGYPMDHTEIRITNNDDKPLPQEFLGHIQIRGENVMSTYYDSSQNDEVFTHDGWLKTGDQGFLKGGELIMTGRTKNLIIINGQNYIPSDIEYILEVNLDIPSGSIIACSNLNSKNGMEELIVFVLHKSSPNNVHEFRSLSSQIKTILDKNFGLIASAIVPVRQFPKTTSGKVRHFQLLKDYRKKKDLKSKKSKGKEENQDSIKQSFKALYREITGNDLDEGLSPSVLFSNSLLTIHFINNLRKRGLFLDVVDIYKSKSLNDIISCLHKMEDGKILSVKQFSTSKSAKLNPSQKRFLFLHELADNKAALNIALRFKIIGVVEENVLFKAIKSLLDTYPILNGSIGENILQVNSYKPDEILQIVRGGVIEFNRPFNLKTGPLWRIVFDLSSNSFWVAIHHIISDGWSINLLIKAFFNHLVQKQSLPTPILFRQNTLMDRRLSNSPWEIQKSYWNEFLKKSDFGSRLNTDVPSWGDFSVDFDEVIMSGNLSSEIYELAERNGTTSFVILMSAVFASIYKITSAKEIVLGTNIAARELPELENQIGLFMRTILVKCQIAEPCNYVSLIKDVANSYLEALDNRDFHYDNLLELKKKNSGDLPDELFEVLVLYQKFKFLQSESLSTSKLKLIENSPAPTFSLSPITIEFIEKNDGIILRTSYRKGIYSKNQIQIINNSIVALLKSMSKNLDGKIQNQKLTIKSQLSGPKYWNKESTGVKNLMDKFNFEYFQERPAIQTISREITYGQLSDWSSKIANILIRDYNISKKCRVALYMKSSIEYIASIFGVLKTGAAYVPIDSNCPTKRIDFLLEDCNPDLILYDSSLTLDVSRDIPKVQIRVEDFDLHDKDFDLAPAQRYEDSTCYIMYTSGTTGRPKGVIISDRSIANYVEFFSTYLKLDSGDKVLQQSSIAFDTAVEEIFPILSIGGTLVIPSQGNENVSSLVSLIDKFEVSILTTTPLIIKEINDHYFVPNSLRAIISGGDVLKTQYLDKIFSECDVYNSYGPTETTICATYSKIVNLDDAPLLGSPIENVSIYIIEESEKVNSRGLKGEIVITGLGVANGYLNSQIETRKNFIPNVFDDSSKLAYKTGDLGLISADGSFQFLGRKDNQLKMRGYRIEPQEIEQVYVNHEKVDDAVVEVSIEDSNNRLTLYYTSKFQQPSFDLEQYASEYLPFYMIPTNHVHLPFLPRTRNGKLDRSRLKTITKTSTIIESKADDIVLKQIRKSWKKVLKLNNVQDDAHLFECGGNSISSVKIASTLTQNLGMHIPLSWLYSYPTVNTLARHITSQKSSTLPKIVRHTDLKVYPLSKGQERIFHLSRVKKTSIAYNESQSFNIIGNLNVSLFIEAFAYIVQRHDMLRAVIEENDSVPNWKILDDIPPSFKVQYIKPKKANNELEYINQIIESDAFSPFDFRKGPLFRFSLIKKENGGYVLSCVMHHIITDGLSVALLFNEWKKQYFDLKTRRKPSLPELDITFGDYVIWQREKLTQDSFGRIREYWKQKLNGVEHIARLPSDFTPTMEGNHKGDRVHFEFDKKELRNIKAYCNNHLCTLFTFFSGILSGLIYRFSGEKDILITYPESGRIHPSLIGIVGFFVDTLLLRVKLTGDITFFTLVQSIKEQYQDDAQNLGIPFEVLADYSKLSPTNLMNNVILVMQEEESSLMKEFSFNGADFLQREKVQKTCKGSIVFFVEEMKNGTLLFDIEYDQDLFRKERIVRYFSNIKEFVKSAIQNPFLPIKKLEILSPRERKFVLFDQNRTFSSNEFNHSQTVVSLFENQVCIRPNAIAITHLEVEISYKQLNDFANQIAKHLSTGCGAKNEDKIAILQERGSEFVVSAIAVLKAGCTYVPIDPYFPRRRIKSLLENSDTSHVLTNNKFLGLADHLLQELPDLKSITCLGGQTNSSYVEMEEQSKQLWDYTAESASNDKEASGWVHSTTKKVFSDVEIEDLISNVIVNVKPLINEKSEVLEIGCGSGLIMFNLHKEVKQYTGTDISSSIVEHCKNRVSRENLSNVQVKNLSAIEIDSFEDNSFDIIILNSVVQYFTHQYFRTFIEQAIKILKADGHIFIADVRDLIKREEFYRYLFQDSNNLEQKIEEQYELEDELFLSRDFFKHFFHNHPTKVDLIFSRKKGTISNELTKFRYNVLISKNPLKSHLDNIIFKKEVFQLSDIKKYSKSNLKLETSRDDTAYILFTSGTTGVPKGVPIKHKGLVNRLLWTDNTFDFKPGDALWQKSPISFDVSVWEMLFPICFGYQSVICPREMVADQDALINYIEEKGITHTHFVPSMLNVFLKALEKHPLHKIKTLKTVFCSGEELLPSTVNALKKLADLKVYNLYGPTEASIDVSFHEAEAGENKIPIGKPISNTRLYILDEHLNPLPVGVAGELHISGVGLAAGYYKNDNLTAKKFVKNPFVKDDTIYKTGDLAYLNEKGEIIYCGRLDSQIKLRGFRIELGEIEYRISEHQAVKEVLSFTIDHHEDQSLCVAIVPDPKYTLLATNTNNINDERKSYLKELPDGKPFFHPNIGEIRFMHKEIFQEEIYSSKNIQIEDGDTIIDVGANGGMFCTYLSCLYNNLTLYAVEPIPELNKCLKWNSDLYNMDLTIFEGGLFDEEMDSALVYYKNNTIVSHLLKYESSGNLTALNIENQFVANEPNNQMDDLAKFANEKEVIRIKLIRLSQLIRNNQIQSIDLLKIDVEGSELSVLNGIDSNHWKKIRQIIVEVEEKATVRSVTDLLSKNGYNTDVVEHPFMDDRKVYMIYAAQANQNAVIGQRPTQLSKLNWVSVQQLEKDLITHCERHLPQYMIPDRWLILNEIPTTLHGKADRKLIAGKLLNKSPIEYSARNEREFEITEIWKKVLGLKAIDITANFFRVGGHSLKATKLMASLNKFFNTEIKLNDIFANPTIKEQAELVTKFEFKKLPPIEPIDLYESYELSNAQKRFWLIDNLEANTYASNMPGSVKFTGELNINALEKALNQVVARHESLRTIFITRKGLPKQQILDRKDTLLKIEFVDLSELNSPTKRAKSIALKEAKLHFNLKKWPLLKVKILKLNQNSHILLFTIHHIISDGRSLEIIVDEMMQNYNAIISCQSITREPLPIQYKDFAQWQNTLLKDETMMEHEKYWLSQFTNIVDKETIPTDFQRPNTYTTSGDYIVSRIDSGLKEKLLEKCLDNDITEFALIYGIINLVILFHGQRSDITLGVPFSNRDHNRLENQVGNYLNLLPMRAQIELSETTNEYIKRIKNIILGAFAHNQYPFDLLIEKLDPPKHMNRMPLFDIGFTFNHENRLSFSGNDQRIFKGLKIELFENTYQSVKADIWFNCNIESKGYKFTIEYNSNLFEEIKIQEIASTISVIANILVTESDNTTVAEVIDLTKKYTTERLERNKEKIRKKNLSKLIADS